MVVGLTSPRKWTHSDLLKLPDDGLRHELIDGVHYVTPSPRPVHQVATGNLYFLIRLHLETHPSGEVWLSPLDVIFSPHDVVEPDVFYMSAGREVVGNDWVRHAPDLAIEVLSPSTRRRDEGVKLRLYEKEGVAEYWLVDPESEGVRVHRRVDDALREVEVLSRATGDALTTPLMPGLSIPLERVFGR